MRQLAARQGPGRPAAARLERGIIVELSAGKAQRHTGRHNRTLTHAGKVMREPALVFVVGGSVALLVVFLFLPLGKVLAMPGAGDWLSYFETPRFVRATLNSLFMAAISTASATILGFAFAYAVTYAEVPGSRIFRIIGLLPLMSPPFVTGLAFILLFGRRGLITWTLLGLRPDIYGWKGLWAVQTFAFFPTAYLSISSVLKAAGSNLEFAAVNLGARRWRVFRDVVLPLATPGIAGAALLVASQVLADFGNPMLIAGDFTVLATESYLELITNWSPARAAVLSAVLLVPALVVFLVQRSIVERRSFVTVTGKPIQGTRTGPAPWLKWGLAVFCLAIALFVLAIYGVILVCAFVKTWGADFTPTAYHFVMAVIHGRELGNSLMLSAAAAAFSALFTVVLAYVVQFKQVPGKALLDFAAVLPSAVPGTVLGIGYVLAFNSGPLAMTGTAFIIITFMVFHYMAVGYRTASGMLKQIDRGIEEASTNLGAHSLRSFWSVMLPLMKPAFTTGLLYTFIRSMNSVSGPIFLISPTWTLASVSIINLADHGYWGQASSLGVAVVGSIFVVLGVARFVLGEKVRLFEI